MSDYYTIEEMKQWIASKPEEHLLFMERDALVQKKDIFYKALNEIQEKHQPLIADCIDEVTHKIELIDQKLDDNDQLYWDSVEV